jgi:hypothetical protein
VCAQRSLGEIPSVPEKGFNGQLPCQTLDQGFGRRDLAVALSHQVGDIYLQLLSEIGECPELLGASFTDTRGDRVVCIYQASQFIA